MASIQWNDAEGFASLAGRIPVELDRFGAWLPYARGVGERPVALGSGAIYAWDFRVDYGASLEIRYVTAAPSPTCSPDDVSALWLAVRLKRHLEDGGGVAVVPTNRPTPFYTCTLAPETSVTITPADPVALEYTVAMTLRNAANAPMPFPY